MATPTPQWHVRADLVTEDTQLATFGSGITQVVKVPYQIDSGVLTGKIFAVSLPADQYTAANVQAAILLDLAAHHEVSQLSG